jgi:beta-barrel assembly-enhancing protease
MRQMPLRNLHARTSARRTPGGLLARSTVAALLAMLAALAGCSVSEDEERQLGEDNARQINEQLPLVGDPEVTTYINDLGRRIATRTSRPDLDWRFYVVDSRQVNAFAVPGGFIYVNRGLVERAETMSELAGVLGHEIGHVVLRHSVKQMEKAGRANVGITLVCSLTGMCNSAVTQMAISVAGTAWFARHSRMDEAAADSDAVVNVLRVGIDPAGIPRMFETLQRERRARPGAVEGWFASHPLEEERVERTRLLVQELAGGRGARLAADSDAYQRFRRRLAAMPPPRMDELPAAERGGR